ncbi:MAG TPA: SGNH/GDSL hydrolase family protein [Candidatus Merdivicinus intestinigallinarum]|nr:SGNH/GDSL hydrolase family protein [Candidatus Merdivicinus intestinigallinarum]
MKKIAFFGDSVTEGSFEIKAPAEPGSAYHALLGKRLPDICTVNAGVGGDRAQNGLDRIQSDVLAHCPDLTVVCFGLNDIPAGKEGLHGYLQALEGIFTMLSPEKTIFMTPNMLNTYVHPQVDPDYRSFAGIAARCQLDGTADTYMEEAVKLAGAMGVTVCNCYQQWKKLWQYGIDTTELLANYINHPTRKMHGLFADALYPLVISKLKEC